MQQQKNARTIRKHNNKKNIYNNNKHNQTNVITKKMQQQ